MASSYRWGSHALNKSRLPPTPPEYQTTYLTPMSTVSDDAHAYYGSRSHSSRHHHSRDYSDRYQQPPLYTTSHSRSKQLPAMTDYTMNYPQPLPMQYQYASTTASILPPIQVPDDIAYATQYAHAHPEPKQKEEKPTGGVAQHLDYEMDMMANFVAEMCQQMVTRLSASPTPQFRKYVSQILSSTRLPSSTIMLGLFYLQERMCFEKTDLTSSSALMRMLTVCLLLGSKFLDDNTFQNRSWAEVSSIPVQELNAMELQWLKDFNWEIHSMMDDPDQGLGMWIDHWHAYEERAIVAQTKTSHKLAPINTNISRHNSVHHAMMSPDGPIPPQYQSTVQYDNWSRPQVTDYSPPSTHYSGPTTPEYYNTNWQYAPAAESYSRGSWNSHNKSAYSAQRAQISPYYASQHNQGYHHINAWSPHGAHANDYYMSHYPYTVQPVIG